MDDQDDDDKDTPVALLRVQIDLPDTVDLDSVDEAERRVLGAVANRKLPYKAGWAVMRMLEHRRRVIADRVLEDRLDEIEARNKELQRQRDEQQRTWSGKP
jgi:hypothetical protein